MEPSDVIESKGAFAKRCEVSPGRVTQWIDEKKLSGAALVGEGRSAKIRVEVALRQIKLRRDVGQALGNGSTTRLAGPSPSAAAPPQQTPSRRADLDADDAPRNPELSLEASLDRLDEELKREKLLAAQAARRETERKEATEVGRYTDTVAVRRQLTMIAVEVMRIFEGCLPEMASALGAEFKREEREVLQVLNQEFRKVRDRAAETAARQAGSLPALVPDGAES